jgi:subtilisin family serine protease
LNHWFFGRSWNRLLSFLLILLSISGLFLTLWEGVNAQTEPLTYVPGELLVKMRPMTTAAATQDLFTRIQAKPLEALNNSGWIRIRMEGNPNFQQMMPYIRKFPQVEMAEPNYVLHAVGIPNDSGFSKLWGLNNTGQTGGKAGADIDAPEAWDVFAPKGNTVVVAVIDSGIDYTHPDLVNRIWANPKETAGNGVDDDHNGYVDDIRGWNFVRNNNNPMDDHNHGTHVAGTIGASFNNSVGVAGVAGPAQIRMMPLKFLDNTGTGLLSNAVKAIDYATANGAVVSNNSWAGGGFSQALHDAIQRNYQAGRLFVAAAGNDAKNTDSSVVYPQGYNVPNIISVAAMTASDSLSSFSNYGAKTTDMAAPGSSIYSTVRGGYALYNGTSMAAPHVTGSAAMMWAQNPALNSVQVKDILMNTTRKVGYLSGKTVSGGVLNLKNALLAAGGDPGTPSPPQLTPTPPQPTPIPQPTPTPLPLPGTPAAPTNLTATPNLVNKVYYSIRQAKLSWKDTAINEAGFEVWRSTSPSSGFTRIKVLPVNTVTWTNDLSWAALKTEYYFKVRSYNSKGPSAFSNVAQINRF